MKRAIVGRCIGTTEGGATVYLVLGDAWELAQRARKR